MKISTHPPIHLTYCLNVHPGQSWAENFQAIREHATRVRQLICQRATGAGAEGILPEALTARETGPFGLGLRISDQASRELSEPGRIEELQAYLAGAGMYAFTINGFPYGQFHGSAVKENVYKPDWRTAERRDYTNRLADILAQLLPEGVSGSISTVPGSYAAWITSSEDVDQMARMFAECAWHAQGIEQSAGRTIRIALEPEPDCFIETVAQAIDFINGPLMRVGGAHLAAKYDLTNAAAEHWVRRHIGVCLDTAHAAVEFEDPAESLRRYASAGVYVSKIQLSSALRLAPTPEAVERLKAFDEPVYLHQTKVRHADGTIASFADLSKALAAAGQGGSSSSEWRVHFHVPLYFQQHEGLSSTSDLLTGDFAAVLRAGACEHLEIETYTFTVLPDFLAGDIDQGIAREYDWVLKNVLRRV